MKWIESKVVFECRDSALAEDLIANVFYDLGLEGVVVEEPGLEPEEGWGDNALPQPEHSSVSGFFPSNALIEKRRGMLEKALEKLAEANHIHYRVYYRRIDEEDWAESWKTYFRPEKITDKLVVKPTWCAYDAVADEMVIELDPGMAFGTGTHPTTSLCLHMLQDHLRHGHSFLDVGTGSGILMIAAAKLGASAVWGIDVDEVAVDIARKNLRENKIDETVFNVMNGDLVDMIDRQFDIVAANILADVIIRLLETLKRVLVPGGIVICSGMIETQRDDVLRKMRQTGFEPVDIREKDSWIAIAAKAVCE